MTLELLQYPNWVHLKQTPYRLGGVEKITCDTELGYGHFSTKIFDTRTFCTDMFEYVRNVDTGKFYVKDGKWVALCATYEGNGDQSNPKKLCHGTYIRILEGALLKCSICGAVFDPICIKEFCHECGAKMHLDGKENGRNEKIGG